MIFKYFPAPPPSKSKEKYRRLRVTTRILVVRLKMRVSRFSSDISDYSRNETTPSPYGNSESRWNRLETDTRLEGRTTLALLAVTFRP